MKITIKNKLMTLGGSSFVNDEAGNPLFKVKGKIGLFSPTKKKKIYDMENNLKFIVRNKFWRFVATSCFIYDENKQKIAMLTNGDFDLKGKFVLKGYTDDVEVNFLGIGKGYDIVKNGNVIGHVQRDFTIVRDSFQLETFDDEEIPFMVTLVIAMDNIWDSKRKQH